MTTLLQLVTQVCNSVPVAAPSSVVGNTNDSTALLCLALANESGEAVATRCPGGWTAATREYDFYTKSLGPYDGGVTNAPALNQCLVGIYADVSEFSAVDDTGWVITGTAIPNNAMITQVIFTPGDDVWAFTLNVPAEQASASGSYTLSQTDYPLPADFARSIDGTFWDRTRYWQMRGAMSPQEWQRNRSSLYGKATIERRWRFRNSDWLSTSSGTPATNVLSIDPIPVDSGSNLVFEYVSNGWCANVSTGARQSEWLADSDYAVFHPYLMRLDLKWRLLNRLGVTYQEALSEYEREADKAVARDGGTMVLNMTPSYGIGLVSPANIQDGFWPGRGT